MGRATGTTRRLALATPQEAATAAGRRAFEEGGNAFDACLAAAVSLAVIYPDNCALGGDLIALVHRADGTRVVINASGPAARGVDVDALRRAGERMPIVGPDPITVPGLIGGLGELWACGAVLGWDRAFVEAIEQARDGVPVVSSLAGSIAREQEGLYRDPGCREVFLRAGAPLREGDLLRQPALTATLERLAAEGPETFYHGPLGRAVVAGLRLHGSPLDLADLAGFVPERVAPVVARFGGAEVASAPANSQGLLMPAILAAAERLGDRLDPLGDDAGRLAAVFRASLAVRERYLCDPLAGDPEGLAEAEGTDLLSWSEAPRTLPRGNGDTVAIVAADDQGNTVSLLQSLFHAFGAAILDRPTGVLFHNRGAGFSLDPSSPNVIAPGKRPAHTLTPCTVFRDGCPQTVIATMGGSGQPQILTEILLRLERGDDAVAAVRAPRWVVGGLGAGDSVDQILLEEGVPAAARDSLADLGLPLDVLPDLDDSLGHSQLIVRTEDGRFTAASDPRSEGAAVVLEG